MKISFERSGIVEILNIVGKSVSYKNPMPLLNCIRFIVKGNTMSITGFDGENALKAKYELISSDKDDSFCINAADITNVLSSINDETVTFEIEKEMCTITHNSGTIQLPCSSAELYPEIKKSEPLYNFTIPAAMLQQCLVDSFDFCAEDVLRPVMNCVYFYLNNKEIGYFASDSHILIGDKFEFPNLTESEENKAFLIPKKSIRTLLSMLAGSLEDNINIKVNKENIIFTLPNGYTFLVRLVEGLYPNAASIIPNSFTTNVTEIDVKAVKAAFKRLSLMDSAKNNKAKISVSESELRATNSDLMGGNFCSENITCESNGVLEFGINRDNFLTCVNAINSDTFSIALNGADKAIILKDEDSRNKVILCMPLRIS